MREGLFSKGTCWYMKFRKFVITLAVVVLFETFYVYLSLRTKKSCPCIHPHCMTTEKHCNCMTSITHYSKGKQHTWWLVYTIQHHQNEKTRGEVCLFFCFVPAPLPHYCTVTVYPPALSHCMTGQMFSVVFYNESEDIGCV